MHRALEVLLGVYGALALAPYKPLKAVEVEAKGSEQAAWRLNLGKLSVDVGKWSGAVKVTPLARLDP